MCLDSMYKDTAHSATGVQRHRPPAGTRGLLAAARAVCSRSTRRVTVHASITVARAAATRVVTSARIEGAAVSHFSLSPHFDIRAGGVSCSQRRRRKARVQ